MTLTYNHSHRKALSMKKLLIAGAQGFVGTRAVQYYRDKYEISSVPSKLLHNADSEEIYRFTEKVNPDIIFNLAAISDTNSCEKDPEASYRANVILPEIIAKAAQKMNSGLVYFSSDQVYNGNSNEGPFKENDDLAPVNVYGRHKLESEKRVLDIFDNAVILRATWMYDMPMYGARNRGNFFINILKAATTRQELSFSSKQHRGITYVRQVVEFLEQAANLPRGIYNYGSENDLTAYDTALTLASILGAKDAASFLKKDSINKKYELWISCDKIRSHGIFFDSTIEGFKRCANDYGVNYPAL